VSEHLLLIPFHSIPQGLDLFWSEGRPKRREEDRIPRDSCERGFYKS
jgi:hypothetical protein